MKEGLPRGTLRVSARRTRGREWEPSGDAFGAEHSCKDRVEEAAVRVVTRPEPTCCRRGLRQEQDGDLPLLERARGWMKQEVGGDQAAGSVESAAASGDAIQRGAVQHVGLR
jgi:hypothetical protein